MKNLLFLGLLILSFLSCKERDADPNVLPPATQTGANTAGCLVDGKVWVATTKYQSTLGGAGTFCENTGEYYKVQLDLRNVSDESRIFIQLNKQNLEIGKIYDLPILMDDNNKIGASFNNNNRTFFSSSPNYTGKIKITRLDIPNNIVSGTFEFKAVDNEGNVVTVTDGRFDKKFD